MDVNSSLQLKLQSLDGDALYEIKKLLRTRSTETQMNAASVLESCLRDVPVMDESFRLFVLEEDIVVFVCDAMATNCWPLLECLLRVLEHLADCSKMFEDGHAALAAETVLQRAHFLVLMVEGKSTDCEGALQATFRLLSKLLHEWRQTLPRGEDGCRGGGRSVSDLCSPEGLMATVRRVVDAVNMSSATTLCAVQTLHSLLDLLALGSGSRDDVAFVDKMATCVRACLQRLAAIALAANCGPTDDHLSDHQREEEDCGQSAQSAQQRTELDVKKDACALICLITASTSRQVADGLEMACALICLITAFTSRARWCCEETGPEWDSTLKLEELEAEALQAMLGQCLPPAVQTISASILNDFRDEEEGLEEALNFLCVLVDCLKYCKDPETLADALTCQNFLWLLPALYRTEHRSVALAVLCSLLANLAHSELSAASWWAQDDEGHLEGHGAADLADFLRSAETVLPSDNRRWPELLLQPPCLVAARGAGPAAAGQLLVVLLTYLRAIAGSDCEQQELAALAECLPEYVLALPYREVEVPPNILRMTWLSFAVYCALLEPEQCCGAANQRLTRLLLGLPDLQAAYTHHPALLYWCFHGQGQGVPPRLQQQVLGLWLARRENPATLLEIVRAQREAVHPLLDVVSSGQPVVAEAAARILAEAASEESVRADLAAGVWSLLPLVLSRGRGDPGVGPGAGPGDHEAAEGCGLLVWLAAEVHFSLSTDMALRVARLLASALGKNRLGATPRHLTAALHILRGILQDSRRRSDSRVFSSLSGDPRFSQALVSAIRDMDPQVCAAALRLLLQLEECSTTAAGATLSLDVGVFVPVVSSLDGAMTEAGLLLLTRVLQPKPNNYIVLQDDDKAVRSLYFILQNRAVTLYAVPAIWSVLKGILTRSHSLCHQPWNYTLLKFVVKLDLEQMSREFFEFALEWLRLMTPAKLPQPTPRRPMPTALTESAIDIAEAILKTKYDFQTQSFVRDVCKQLLAVTANLPTSLISKIRDL